MSLKKLADEYRSNERPDLTGGVVVIFRDKVAGWMNELRDPQSWEPGCIAIDEDGHQWVSVGGNAYDGAKSWQPVRKENREKALIMIPSDYHTDSFQGICEIPQIDVSGMMPCYPGQAFRLGGVRICVEASPERHSRYIHIDFLFRVSSPTQFLAAASWLWSIRSLPESYQQRILADPYPIEIFQRDQIYQVFSIGEQRSDTGWKSM